LNNEILREFAKCQTTDATAIQQTSNCEVQHNLDRTVWPY